MTAEALKPIQRRVEQAIDEAAADGALERLKGAGRPLKIDDAGVPSDLRVPLKVLENAGLAPDWIELAREIEERVESLRAARRAHIERMRGAREHALAGPAGDFAARFRAAGRMHAAVQATLSADVGAISRLIDRFNTIAPDGAPRPGFLPRSELDAIETIWPWPPREDEPA